MPSLYVPGLPRYLEELCVVQRGPGASPGYWRTRASAGQCGLDADPGVELAPDQRQGGCSRALARGDMVLDQALVGGLEIIEIIHDLGPLLVRVELAALRACPAHQHPPPAGIVGKAAMGPWPKRVGIKTLFGNVHTDGSSIRLSSPGLVMRGRASNIRSGHKERRGRPYSTTFRPDQGWALPGARASGVPGWKEAAYRKAALRFWPIKSQWFCPTFHPARRTRPRGSAAGGWK